MVERKDDNEWQMIEITMPVYFTQEFKTKPSKTFLVGMNWYRNAHHFSQNNVKKHYHELLVKELTKEGIKPFSEQYGVVYTYHYKSKVSDNMNVASMMSKFLNDTLQEMGIVPNDNVQYCIEERCSVGEHNKDNPHMQVQIHEIKEINESKEDNNEA